MSASVGAVAVGELCFGSLKFPVEGSLVERAGIDLNAVAVKFQEEFLAGGRFDRCGGGWLLRERTRYEDGES
jgi:hypothetical protein